MTQGKIERYHRSMKNVVKLENYYSPWELERAVVRFVDHYNHRRLHEALENVTPADVYEGRRPAILARRQQIKRRTLAQRRRENLQTPTRSVNWREVSFLENKLTGLDWFDDVHLWTQSDELSRSESVQPPRSEPDRSTSGPVAYCEERTPIIS